LDCGGEGGCRLQKKEAEKRRKTKMPYEIYQREQNTGGSYIFSMMKEELFQREKGPKNEEGPGKKRAGHRRRKGRPFA